MICDDCENNTKCSPFVQLGNPSSCPFNKYKKKEMINTQCVCETCKKIFHVTHEIHADIQSVLYQIHDEHDKIRTKECNNSILNLRVLNRTFYPNEITYDVWVESEKSFKDTIIPKR